MEQEFAARLALHSSNFSDQLTRKDAELKKKEQDLTEALLAKESELADVKKQLQLQPPGGVGNALNEGEARELSAAKHKIEIQQKERAALKVILEKKMKVLIDNISSVVVGDDENGNTSSVPSRTQREVQVLKRLVDASVAALNHLEDTEG